MGKRRKHARRTVACAIVLTLLFTACGKKEPQSDGLVPMETAKSYEHVAKAENTEPTPDIGDGQGQGAQGSDVGGSVTPPPVTGAPQDTVTPAPDDGTGEDIVYVAVSKLNLRAEPSLESEVIAQAKYGDSFVRTEKGTEGWDKLLYNGQEVYAFAEYLSDKKVAGMKNSIHGQLAADAKKK